MNQSETTVRRHLREHGLRVSRRTDRSGNIGYMVTDENNCVVAGGGEVPYGLNLDGVAEVVEQYR